MFVEGCTKTVSACGSVFLCTQPVGGLEFTDLLFSVVSSIRELLNWNGNSRIFNNYGHVHRRAGDPIAYSTVSFLRWGHHVLLRKELVC